MITQMKLLSRKKDLTIFVHTSEKSFLEDFIFHSYLFRERLGFDLNVISFDEEVEVLLIDNFRFTSKLNSHLNKYKKTSLEASSIQENKLGFASLSFLFRDDKNSCIYP